VSLKRLQPGMTSDLNAQVKELRMSARVRKANASSSRSTCMSVSLSSPLPSGCSFLSLRHPAASDTDSFDRGHVLQGIGLYPVRAEAPSSHNWY
jgi:hypothetical protein